MNAHFLLGCAFAAAAAASAMGATAGAAQTHRSAPAGSYGGIMNPDISAIVNTQILFTDDRGNERRGDLRIAEGELAFQSYLYPGIEGSLIIAMHEEHGEWHVHPEEAFAAFQDLPFGLQATVGRRLIPFGRLNPTHPHHWKFPDQPLPHENFFGAHPLYDDGAEVSWLVPNPWNVYGALSIGAWSGSSGSTGAHHHEEEEEHVHEHHAPVLDWRGRIYSGRARADVPLGELSNAGIGYSAVWDEARRTVLHGADLTAVYRRPGSYARVHWQSEIYYADIKGEEPQRPFGFFSTLSFAPDKYWEIGARYDRSEYIKPHDHEHDEEHETAWISDEEWSASAFLSYYLTHSLYLRSSYRRIIDRREETEHRIVLQLVWGLGPHAHRIEN